MMQREDITIKTKPCKLQEAVLSERIAELQKKAKEKGFQLEFAQPLIDSRHLMSTWYSGEIATLSHNNRTISFVCTEKVRLTIMDKVMHLPKYFFIDANCVGAYYCPDFRELFDSDEDILEKEAGKEIIWTSRSIVRPEFKMPNGEPVDYKKSTIVTKNKKKICLDKFLFYDENILDIFSDVERFIPLFDEYAKRNFVTSKRKFR